MASVTFIFGACRFFLSVLCIFFAILPEGEGNSAESSDYAEYLIGVAAERQLSDDPYWWTLLHYKKQIVGVESLVDDPDFFLAPDGKHDPKAELEAVIRVFFNAGAEKDAPSICHFYARYTWLKERLAVDESRIPAFSCDKVDKIQARSATVIFPTYYMNNPASMFGHTFINIETDYSSKLLTNAVNYTANTGSSSGVFYTFNGVFGFFKGYFSILPYYKKIQEYSDIDQRDIWEYGLNLTEDELKRFVMHLYELDNVYSYYYFFDENCSYNLLFLLDAARPSLNLTESLPPTVIPIDTIKVMKEKQLVETAEFRPSNGTKIRHKLAQLSDDEQETAFQIAMGTLDPEKILSSGYSRERRVRIVDLATDYVKYLLIKEEITRRQYQRIILKNLKVRSRLGKVEGVDYVVSPPPDPSLAPDSRRVALTAGREDGRGYQEVSVRPAFADLLTRGYGDSAGIQLMFLDTRVRHYEDDSHLKLEAVDLLNIVSLSPRDRFFKPLSWKLNTGVVRKFMDDEEKKLVYRFNGGAGLSWHSDWAGLFFVMPELEFDAGGNLRKNNALGAGISAGVVKEFHPSWKGLVTAGTMHYETGDRHREQNITVAQRISLTDNISLRMEYAWNRQRSKSFNNAWISLNITF